MKPNKILMCPPDFFEVNYVGNEFMKGNINNVDKNKAEEEWNALRNTYSSLGFEVLTIKPVKDLVDMVFTANQSLPFIATDGKKSVILSKMRNPQRQGEVPYFRKFYEDLDYNVIELSDNVQYFESMGDCVIDYDRNILFGGFGFRTHENTFDEIAKYTDFNIVKLKLINPVLYHLDTCFSVLDSRTAVVCPEAFDEKGLKLINEYFERTISAELNENLDFFVCNCHCPDGKNVIVQKGSKKFGEDIKKSGFNLIEVETGEFMKSGGSVFCLKLMIY